jgi:hypothetical protein
VALVATSSVLTAAGTAETEPLPAEKAVSFRTEIAPLLQRRCLTCHNDDSAKGGYRVESFAKLLHPGDSELAPIVPGKASESEWVHLLREPDANERMPQKADPLPALELALIERWIDQGAVNDGGPDDRPIVELARATLLHPAPVQYARPSPVTALAFSPDGTQLAVSGYFEVTLWDLASESLVQRIAGLPERITSLAWDRTSGLLVIGGGTPAQWGTVAIVDPASGFPPHFLCDLPEVVNCVAVAAEKPMIAAAGGDRTVRFFALPDGKQKRVLRQHADWVQAVALSNDGRHAVSGGRDRTVKVFDTRTGELESTYTGHDTPVMDVALSSNGAHAFSIARDKTLHRWNRQNGTRESDPFTFPTDVLRIAIVMAEEDRVITGGADATVRISQISDRQTLFTLQGHRDMVQSIALSPDGKTFATGSYDGEVCVWETACGTWLHRFVASPMSPGTHAEL